MAAHTTTLKTPPLSSLVTETLHGLSPIQTIMKMTEHHHLTALGLKPDDVISFGGGWCNHEAPQALRDTYQQIITDPDLFHQSGRYSAIKGSHACREQLAAFEQRIFHVNNLTPYNLLIGQSSTQLFHDILRVLCNPGDTILFLDPAYANYFNAVRCALPTSPMRFLPALDPQSWTYLPDPHQTLVDLDTLCRQNPRCKALVITVPDNPTSQIPSDAFLTEAEEILTRHHRFLILDFAYKALWFNAMPDCFSWSPLEHPNVVSLHTNSKWLSSLGRRFGWAEADPTIITGLEKINESVLLSPDTLHSMTTARFLQETLDDGSLPSYIETTRKLYRDTASILLHAMDTHLDWPKLTPTGGLYTCSPIPDDTPPFEFVDRLLQATGVLVIPGTGFGPSMEHGIRLSYGPLCRTPEKIREGIERIGAYCEK
jgi:aspartate/methionine/tyrosine aminotransferase